MFKRLGYLTRQVTYNKRCIVDGALIKSKFQKKIEFEEPILYATSGEHCGN